MHPVFVVVTDIVFLVVANVNSEDGNCSLLTGLELKDQIARFHRRNELESVLRV
jgi:hypothetical protein